MKIIVSGRNIDLTKAIKDHVTDKFHKLEQHYDFIQEVHVFLSVEKNPSIKNSQRAEATIHVNGAVIRIEEAWDDLYVSIDHLVNKVDRSLRKHKDKLLSRSKSGRSAGGESIRKAVTEEELAAEAEALADTTEAEIFFTYTEEEVPVS